MVSRNCKISYEFDDETYEKYKNWREQNCLDGYHRAIEGSHYFQITLTSIGNFVNAIADVPLKGEAGNISYDKSRKMHLKRVELILDEL